jgi:phosphatidylglycerophosphatase A
MGEEVPKQTPPLGRTRFSLEALVGSVLFTGYFPVAPATVTSLFMLLPAFFLARFPVLHALITITVFFVGVPIATDLERVWGKDPGRVTIDEVAGTLVTFLLNPVSAWGLGVGFLLWRFFDIFKLPFIDKSQRLSGGWGIMVDDVLAGICANLVLRLGLLFLPVLRFHQ